jgi:hypothetical protein
MFLIHFSLNKKWVISSVSHLGGGGGVKKLKHTNRIIVQQFLKVQDHVFGLYFYYVLLSWLNLE